MSLIAELTLRGQTLFVRTFTDVPDAECRLENVYCMGDQDGFGHYIAFCWVANCELDEFDRALDGDPTVRNSRVITEFEGRRLYRIATIELPPEQPRVYPLLREHDAVEIEGLLTANGLELEVRFPSRSELKAFLAAVEDIADSTTVNRLYREERVPRSNPSLTEKQRNALTIALERGYFDTPSASTLGELADEEDVTPQTLSRHLRVGVKKVLERHVEPARSPSKMRL